MARVLKVPSEKFRDKVFKTLNEYLTTIRRELGDRAPSWEDGKELLITHFAEALGAEVERGELTDREWRVIEELDAVLASEAWTEQRGGLRRAGVKIAEGIHVREAAHKAPGGLIRTTVVERAGAIDDLVLSGDFFCYPPEAIPALERSLIGTPLEEEVLTIRIAAFLTERGVQLPAVEATDLAKAILLTQTPS
jgi:lipoate-protein ligase A